MVHNVLPGQLAAYFMVAESYHAPEQDLLELNLPVSMGGQADDPASYLERAEFFIGSFEHLHENIHANMEAADIRTLVYDAGKLTYGRERLRDYFRDFYLIMFGRTEGSQIDLLIQIWGVDEFMEQCETNMSNLFL